jgi:cytoplasmic iron level regulating protein YaaA (DUF328/UPF0246 family)
VLFLIPPSETKVAGGRNDSLDLGRLSFSELLAARETVIEAAAQSGLFNLGSSSNLMAAVDRYSGTLYSAIHGRGLKGTPTANNQLSDEERNRAGELLFIQSALFGLISATDEIPEYKISATKNIAGLNLKRHWAAAHADLWSKLSGEIIVDLRSKAYAEQAPLPNGELNFTVEVFYRSPEGQLSQMNHFNKKAKGQLVRSVLQAQSAPATIADLVTAAKSANLDLQVQGQKLTLITSQAN